MHRDNFTTFSTDALLVSMLLKHSYQLSSYLCFGEDKYSGIWGCYSRACAQAHHHEAVTL